MNSKNCMCVQMFSLMSILNSTWQLRCSTMLLQKTWWLFADAFLYILHYNLKWFQCFRALNLVKNMCSTECYASFTVKNKCSTVAGIVHCWPECGCHAFLSMVSLKYKTEFQWTAWFVELTFNVTMHVSVCISEVDRPCQTSQKANQRYSHF